MHGATCRKEWRIWLPATELTGIASSLNVKEPESTVGKVAAKRIGVSLSDLQLVPISNTVAAHKSSKQ